MKRIFYCILFAICLFGINNRLQAQYKHRKANSHAPGEDIYKHYVGTIGDRHIALDLRYGYQGGSNYGGSCYYDLDKEGTTHIIIGEPESFDHGVPMRAEEGKENMQLGKDAMFPDRNNLTAMWHFVIFGDSLTGTYENMDTKNKYDLHLKEDYSKSYEMDMIVFTNDRSVKNSVGKPLARMYFMGVRPSLAMKEDDATFINDAQLAFSGAAKIGATNWEDYFRLLTKRYLEKVISKKDTSSPFFDESILPVYNDNGLLVLEKTIGFDDTISYLCLDVYNKKQIHLKDALDVNNKKLSELLERSLREKYRLDHDKKLSTWLLVDEIPVTENIMLTNKGINFTYNDGEIYKTSGDFRHLSSLNIFLSYDQLSGMLKPEFKKRMNL